MKHRINDRVLAGFRPVSRLFPLPAIILAIALSTIPAVRGQQPPNYTFGGRINPQVVLPPNTTGYLQKKFYANVKGSAEAPIGRYRVTIVGFDCNHETRDDFFATDGLSDEIRLDAETRVVDRDGEVLLQASTESRVMGSINNDEWRRTRVQAGSADRFGGIRTGDSIPSRPAYNGAFDPRGPRNPELPFLLFEGDLVQGLNSVVIVPTVWEIDGGAGLFPRFQRAIADAAPALIRLGATLAAGPTTGKAVGQAADVVVGAGDRLLTGIRGGDGGDRVVGIHGSGDQGTFTPLLIRLNYEIAELALRTRFPGPSDMPPGVIPINYRDESDLNGNYTLYIKIERLKSINSPG